MTDMHMVILMRIDLGMKTGKMCSQAGHASWACLVDDVKPQMPDVQLLVSAKVIQWARQGMKKICLRVDNLQDLNEMCTQADAVNIENHCVTDATLQVVTCAALGPDESGKLRALTAHLKLL